MPLATSHDVDDDDDYDVDEDGPCLALANLCNPSLFCHLLRPFPLARSLAWLPKFVLCSSCRRWREEKKRKPNTPSVRKWSPYCYCDMSLTAIPCRRPVFFVVARFSRLLYIPQSFARSASGIEERASEPQGFIGLPSLPSPGREPPSLSAILSSLSW